MLGYFVLENFVYGQDMSEGDVLLELHVESLESSPQAVNTKFDEILGVIPLGLAASNYTMSTDGVVTAGAAQGAFTNVNTVEVKSSATGEVISFFLVGRVKAITL